MPLLEFEPCRERIARAQAHATTFAKTWSEFVADELYSPVVRVEDDGVGGLWVKPWYSPMPAIFALELGEFLYNLRAALDHAVYGAAIIESRTNPPPHGNTLEFPICETPEQFEKADWKIAPLTGHRRRIIKDMQPYNVVKNLRPDLLILSPHRNIGMLHDWARKDRHRRLHVVGSWASNVSPVLNLPAGVTIRKITSIAGGLLEHDSQVASFELSGWEPGMDITANPNLSIDVALDEIPPPAADNDTLGQRIRMMTAFVKEIVHAIEDSIMADRAGREWPDPRNLLR